MALDLRSHRRVPRQQVKLIFCRRRLYRAECIVSCSILVVGNINHLLHRMLLRVA